MTQRTLLLGGPGCGKTTSLLNIVEGLLNDGIPPDRIAFLAFTRKAAQEARERAKTKFNLTDDDLPHFRTIHSFAFKQLGLTRSEVLGTSAYKDIGADLGLTFGQIDDDLGLPIGVSRGDRFSHIEQLARVMDIPLKKLCLSMQERYYDVKLFSDTLSNYKKVHHVLDFTDMLQQFLDIGDSPKFDAVIVDEGQDLSPLQWKVVEKIFKGVPKTWIAGDDDQAIYKWAGADIEKFLSLDGKRIVLPRSHRLCPEVFALCNKILKRIKHRYEKQWEPDDHHGSIKRYSQVEYVDYSQGSWLVLARHKHMLAPYRDHLMSVGIPYILGNKSSTDNDNVRAMLAWEKLRKGGTITDDLARTVYRKLKKGCVDIEHKKLPQLTAEYVSLSTLQQDHGLRTTQNWMNVLKMPTAQRAYYRAIKKRGESLVKTPRVTISTIHAVKGGEAENVALIPDITDICYRDMVTTPDNEARCFYVGASRAINGLHIIHPHSQRFFSI